MAQTNQRGVTSSRTRSTRKATKPVTGAKPSNRGNRSRTSTATTTSSSSRATNTGARVTNSSQRTNTGSARVTGQPAAPQRALPPGQRGGALSTRSDVARMRGGSDSVRGGGTRTGTGTPPRAALPNGNKPVRVRDLGNSKPPARPALPPGKSGGALATRATGAGLGRAGLVGGALSAILSAPEEIRKGRDLLKDPKGTAQKVLDDLGITIVGAGDKNRRAAQSVIDDRRNRAIAQRQVDARKPQGPPGPDRLKNAPPAPKLPPPSGGGSSGGGRSSGGGSRSSSPAIPRAAQPKATPAPAAEKKPAAAAPKGPNIGPLASGDTYGKAKKLQAKIEGNYEGDMKRRRAFLDAKDSMSGIKAVKELQEKRKKRLGKLTEETTITPSKK